MRCPLHQKQQQKQLGLLAQLFIQLKILPDIHPMFISVLVTHVILLDLLGELQRTLLKHG